MTKYAQNINAGSATIESPDKTKQKLGITMINDETPNLGQGESPIMSENFKAFNGEGKQNAMDTSTHQAEKVSSAAPIAGLNYRGSLVENRNNNAFISSMAET